MSVTFYATDCPRERVRKPCDVDGCAPPSTCGYCDNGFLEDVEYEIEPLNMNNGNAAAMLRLLGLDSNEPCGSVTHAEIGSLRQRLTVLRNSERQRSRGIRETSEETGSRVARIFTGGLDDDGILYRVEKLDELFAAAQTGGYGIHWG